MDNEGGLQILIFPVLCSESGFLHKVVLLDQGPWIIEEIQVFPEAQPRASLLLSTAKVKPFKHVTCVCVVPFNSIKLLFFPLLQGVLFIGTSEGITSVPLSHCSIYRTCSQCIMARDPQCGWSLIRGVCDNVNNEESVYDFFIFIRLLDSNLETDFTEKTSDRSSQTSPGTSSSSCVSVS